MSGTGLLLVLNGISFTVLDEQSPTCTVLDKQSYMHSLTYTTLHEQPYMLIRPNTLATELIRMTARIKGLR